MKKIYKLTFLSLLFVSGSLISQNKTMSFPHCETDEAMEEVFKADPSARERFNKSQEEYQRLSNLIPSGYKMNPNSVFASPFAKDTIPVVFHILHENGPENIPNSYVYQALKTVNEDYQKMASDTSTVDTYFQPRHESCNLVFKLATKDPNGNCTNGIVRYYDPNTNWDRSTATNNGINNFTHTWNPTKYLNVYIVKDIVAAAGQTGIVVGYTYRPGTWSTGVNQDAIVYNYAFLTGSNARSLSHEIGHWFGLAHTFGSTNSPGTCGNDNLGSISGQSIDDTPATTGAFSTCPLGATNSCASEPANVENIMDYSSCPKMFTLGQCKRMRNTITVNTSGRGNLVSATNKNNTGIRNPIVCVPSTEFRSNKRIVCTNSTVTFYDSTYNAQVTGWQWSFPGGTPSTSTDSIPVVTYSTPGVYSVSYTASNSAGNNTITKTNYITVVNNTASYAGQFSEGFETISVPNADWTVDNTGGGVSWVQDNTLGASGTSCMKINNFNNASGAVETLLSPSFDLNSIYLVAPPVSMTFKLAYKRENTSGNEKLQVFSSTNCGQTWSQRYSKAGSSLAANQVSSTAFVPSATDWRTETINVLPVSNLSNVLFKFVFTSDASGNMNNVYIDDINITGSVGIDNEVDNMLNLSVYPNPSNNGMVTISFDLIKNQHAILTVTDMLGRNVSSMINSKLSQGNYKFTVGESTELSKGIYFIQLNLDGKVFTQKFIVE